VSLLTILDSVSDPFRMDNFRLDPASDLFALSSNPHLQLFLLPMIILYGIVRLKHLILVLLLVLSA